MAAESLGFAFGRSFGAATKGTAAAVSVGVGATLVLAANNLRKSALIVNAEATGGQTVYLGKSGVTTASGIPLSPGASLTDNASTDAWYAIAGATADVRVLETVHDT